MGLKKRIRVLNDLLRTELGEDPLMGWQWSNDLKLVGNRNKAGEMEFDYGCQCGVNVRPNEHADDCSQIVFPKVREQIMPRLPDYPNHWVLCHLAGVEKKEHSAVNKTDSGYRKQLWEPVPFDNIPAPGYAMQQDEPSRQDTEAIIRRVKDFRSMSIREWYEEMERKDQKREADCAQYADDAIDEAMGIHPEPGAKDFKSFPTREKDKHRGVSHVH